MLLSYTVATYYYWWHLQVSGTTAWWLTIGGWWVELLRDFKCATKFSLYTFYTFLTTWLHKLTQLLECDAILRRTTIYRGHRARCSRSTITHHAHGTPTTPSSPALPTENKEKTNYWVLWDTYKVFIFFFLCKMRITFLLELKNPHNPIKLITKKIIWFPLFRVPGGNVHNQSHGNQRHFCITVEIWLMNKQTVFLVQYKSLLWCLYKNKINGKCH